MNKSVPKFTRQRQKDIQVKSDFSSQSIKKLKMNNQYYLSKTCKKLLLLSNNFYYIIYIFIQNKIK